MAEIDYFITSYHLSILDSSRIFYSIKNTPNKGKSVKTDKDWINDTISDELVSALFLTYLFPLLSSSYIVLDLAFL
jgi:hypothetical protein